VTCSPSYAVKDCAESQLCAAPRCVGRHPIEKLVVMAGIVMEEDQRANVCLTRHLDRILDGAVPPVRAVRELVVG